MNDRTLASGAGRGVAGVATAAPKGIPNRGRNGGRADPLDAFGVEGARSGPTDQGATAMSVVAKVSGTGYSPRAKWRIAACCMSIGWIDAASRIGPSVASSGMTER